MLLEDYSSDGINHPHCVYPHRRSSVTFEDEVEQIKGMLRLGMPITELYIRGECLN